MNKMDLSECYLEEDLFPKIELSEDDVEKIASLTGCAGLESDPDKTNF